MRNFLVGIGVLMWIVAGVCLFVMWVVTSRFMGAPDKTWWIGAPVTVLVYVITVPWPKKEKKKT